MRKQIRKQRKLIVTKETVRALGGRDLQEVAGAVRKESVSTGPSNTDPFFTTI